MFFDGMNKSSLHSEYCKNVEEELGKIAIEEVAEDMEEILSHFNKLNGQLLDKYYKEKADKIFKCIPMKMEIFYEKFDKECMKIPIFKYSSQVTLILNYFAFSASKDALRRRPHKRYFYIICCFFYFSFIIFSFF